MGETLSTTDGGLDEEIAFLTDQREREVNPQGDESDQEDCFDQENALRESEQRFRALFEQSNDAVFIIGLDLVLLNVNERASEMLGYQVDEMVGKSIQHFVAAEEWGSTMEQLPLILSGDQLPVFERTFVKRKGLRLSTEMSVALVNDSYGKPMYIQSIARDMAERKRAEKVIREERALLRTLIDNIPAFIFAKDEEGSFILNNRYHIQSMGAKHQNEVLGMTDLEIFPKELAEEYCARDRAVLTFGFPIIDKQEIYERQDTGEKIWISSTKAPLKDDDGNVTGLVGISTDITERKQVEMALRESEEKFRLLSEQSLLGIIIIQDDVVKYCNQAACDLVGYNENELLAWAPLELTKIIHPEDEELVIEQMQKKQSGEVEGLIPHYAYRMITKSGKTVWVEQYSKTIHYQGRSADLVTLIDISERKMVEERLHHLATHDPLTDLPNRIMFIDRLGHALAIAKRYGNKVALLFIDLDGFKEINDEHGHEIGDRVLKVLACRLVEGARESDTIARLAGDEFIYILENVTDNKEPSRAAERLLASINEPFMIEGSEISLSASIGVSIFPEDGEDPHELLRNADLAMYRNKEAGKNGYVMFS